MTQGYGRGGRVVRWTLAASTQEERSPRAVAMTALSSSASAVLEEAYGIAVCVLHGDDLPAAADVTDLPLHLPAGVQ